MALDWSASLGEGGASAPTVTNRFIAVGTEAALLVLEPGGARRCRIDMGGRVFTPRQVDDERLLAASGTSVQLVDARCNVLWKHDVSERVASAPAVTGEIAVVPTMSGRVLALALVDGKQRWAFTGPDHPESFMGPAAVSTPDVFGPGEATVAAGAVYLIDAKGELFAIRAEDGGPLWSVRLAQAAASTPVVANGRVVVGTDDGGVHALDTATHALVWQVAADARVRGAALVDENQVVTGSDDRHVYAFDADSGAPRWMAPTEGPVRARPVRYRNLVLAAGGYGDGRLYALNRDDGTRFWEHGTDTGVVSDLSVLGDTVYAASVEGTLYAFRIWRTFEQH